MKSNHTIINYHHIKAETDNTTINSVMGLKEWGLIILLSIVWGGSFFFAKVAVKEMTPLTIVLLSSWLCLPRPLSLFMVNRKENANLTRPLGRLYHHGCAE